MLKRIFDVVVSIIAILILIPVFLIIAVYIKIDSKGNVIYKQVRVGKNNNDFNIFKFRTMHIDADKLGLITIGGRDPRVTKAGYFLRKFKLDELPQLFNVLFGDMSLVGPRPEVRKYVDMYSNAQLKVLSVKPGITDYASILYADENELLANSTDAEAKYINEVMPHKLSLNLDYIQQQSFLTDLKILFKTVLKIIS